METANMWRYVVDKDVDQVWIAAADLESVQQQADAAELDLAAAVGAALESGRPSDEVGIAAGLTSGEMEHLMAEPPPV
ncbi:MAG: hypothetical protein ACHP7K_11475 [Actinomycetales bacterium]